MEGISMLKKIVIVCCFVFLLFGCSVTETNETAEPSLETMLYESRFQLKLLQDVYLFQSIYIHDLKDLNGFTEKSSIFDSVKKNTIELGVLNLNTSEAALRSSFDSKTRKLESTQYKQYFQTKTYAKEYSVKDFTTYLSESFLQDMNKLEQNQTTADQIINQYGTHVIMATHQGFMIRIELSIRSVDLTVPQFGYIRTMLMETRPISFPITDPTYVLYESMSRIEMNIITTPSSYGIEEILNQYDMLQLPLANIITAHDIVPIYDVFGFANSTYPKGIALLKARYQELFPS
jgi:hypothetical protein